MSFEPRLLGRTGLRVGPLGVAASYGVRAAAVERAFEQGANYLYWGSIRRKAFGEAVRRLAKQRDRMVLVLQSYSRMASLVGWSVERALGSLRLDYADVLLLGMWNKPVPPAILEASRRLKERGLVRFLAVSTHRRALAPALAPEFEQRRRDGRSARGAAPRADERRRACVDAPRGRGGSGALIPRVTARPRRAAASSRLPRASTSLRAPRLPCASRSTRCSRTDP